MGEFASVRNMLPPEPHHGLFLSTSLWIVNSPRKTCRNLSVTCRQVPTGILSLRRISSFLISREKDCLAVLQFVGQ